jgi:hypothetical protein
MPFLISLLEEPRKAMQGMEPIIEFSNNSIYNRVAGGHMIKSSQALLEEFKDYQNPFDHIRLLVRDGQLIKLKRGLYEDDKKADPFSVAGLLYAPSYISFQSALSFYGLIPERVLNITSASLKANKEKRYLNQFGAFIYQDVPPAVFSLSLNWVDDPDSPYLIATKEKALCDLLAKIHPVESQEDLKALLFEDLRIDEDGLKSFKLSEIEKLAKAYQRKNLSLLLTAMKGGI